MDQIINDFAVYEDSVELLGMAKATLPDLSFITQNVSGAGIAGTIEAVSVGHINNMTLTLEFLLTNKSVISLSEPRRHNIDLRIAQQVEDPVSGTINSVGVKHIFVLVPKTDKGGAVAPASAGNGSGEYAVRYWKTVIDGEVVREIDPLNYKCEINGVDYLAGDRKALGK